ncbi:MAG: FkbM family methyltransferase [Ilumatobacteraceae bacterium]
MRPAVLSSGLWEPGETRLLRTLVRPGCRFLDVGAHVGYFSVVAHQSAAGVVITAIEPDPFTARLCELNLHSAGAQARVITCALGDINDTLAFTVAAHNPGDSRVDASASKASAVVPVLPADQLLEGASFDIIKIDVQGFEERVMLGMQDIIARSKGLQMLVEFFPVAIAESGSRPVEVLEAYQTMGFEVHALVGEQVRTMSSHELVALCASAGEHGFVTLLLSKR